MKCYFMIGLPTETDEDVAGIAQTGGRLKRLGRKIRKDADVTVSVSSHVPKPHTPFQWCAMDSIDEIQRKQRLLRDAARGRSASTLKYHEAGISHVEGILSRGDRRLGRRHRARVARRRALRRLGRAVLARRAGTRRSTPCGVDARALPVDASRRRAAAVGPHRRRSRRGLPGVGVPARAQGSRQPAVRQAQGHAAAPHQHRGRRGRHAQAGLLRLRHRLRPDADARASAWSALRKLGAHKPTVHAVEPRRAAASFDGEPRRAAAREAPAGFAQARRARAVASASPSSGAARSSRTSTRCACSSACSGARGVEMIYSKGFHPKPQLVFAPALGLGVAALGELCDVRIDFDGDAEALVARLRAAAPEGLRRRRGRASSGRPIRRSRACSRAPTTRPGCRRRRRALRTEGLDGQRAAEARHEADRRRPAPRRRARSSTAKRRRGCARRSTGRRAAPSSASACASSPTAAPSRREVIEALTGATPPEGARYARTALWAQRDVGLVDPMELETLRAAPVAAVPAPEGAVVAGDPDGGAAGGTNGVLPVAAAAADRN